MTGKHNTQGNYRAPVFEIDSGYVSPYFVTDTERMVCSLDDPYVVLCEGKVSEMQNLLPALELAAQEDRPFLMVASEVEGEALATLVVNKLKGVLTCCAIPSPKPAVLARKLLHHIAKETGALLFRTQADFPRDAVWTSAMGRAIRVSVTKETATFYGVPALPEEDASQEYVALSMVNDKVRVVSLAWDGTYTFLDGFDNRHGILYLANAETRGLEEAVAELEQLMNCANSKEADFQAFFEKHPDFILNEQYRAAHSHILLSPECGPSMIPDFVLEPVDQSSLCDLLELKTPHTRLFVLKKSRMRFSAAVMEACAQLREYSAFFEEERNRERIKERYGLSIYRPRMLVILGRRGTVDPIVARRIEGDVPQLVLRSYDDVVAIQKARLERMRQQLLRGMFSGSSAKGDQPSV